MKFSEIVFKVNISSFVVFIFGTIAAVIGFIHGSPIQTVPDNVKEFTKTMTVPILFGSLPIINYIISQEINAKVREREREIQEEKKREVQIKFDENKKNLEEYVLKKYKRELDEISNLVKSLDNKIAEKDKILTSIISIENLLSDYTEERRQAVGIAKWLEKKQREVFNIAYKAVSKEGTNFPENYLDEFSKDIECCIVWLCDSIKELESCEVEEKHYSAMKFIGYKHYETALNSIEKYIADQDELKEYDAVMPHLNKIFEVMRDHLKDLSIQY